MPIPGPITAVERQDTVWSAPLWVGTSPWTGEGRGMWPSFSGRQGASRHKRACDGAGWCGTTEGLASASVPTRNRRALFLDV